MNLLPDIVHGRMERQDIVAHVSVAGSLAKWAASLNVQSSKRGAAKRSGSRAQAIRIVYTSAHHLRTSAMLSQRALLSQRAVLLHWQNLRENSKEL